MRDESSYAIEAFDADGCTMGAVYRNTLKEAKEYAKYMLTPAYANVIESQRVAIRVEVANREGDVIWDKSLSKLPLLTIRHDSSDNTYFAADDRSGESWVIEGAKNQSQAIRTLRDSRDNPFRLGC